jgi:hypothetical protein
MQMPRYIVSFEAQPFRSGKRYHWMICRAENPDTMMSWGHASTPFQAEEAALIELKSLSSGNSQGGRAISKPLSPEKTQFKSLRAKRQKRPI